MSGRGPGPFNNQMESELKKYLSFDHPELALQPVGQKNVKTRDKSSGRKPSATTSIQEDKTMNTVQGSSTGRDVVGNGLEGSTPPAVRTAETEQIREFIRWGENLEKKVNEIGNPLSLSNFAKYGVGAGITLALGGVVYWTVGLFRSNDVVVPVKPAVIK